MLGEPLLAPPRRIPPDDDLVRFLVVAPERTELLRHKLERRRSCATAMESGNWHILKCEPPPRLARARGTAARRPRAVPRARPAVERRGEQMPLFEG